MFDYEGELFTSTVTAQLERLGIFRVETGPTAEPLLGRGQLGGRTAIALATDNLCCERMSLADGTL